MKLSRERKADPTERIEWGAILDMSARVPQMLAVLTALERKADGAPISRSLATYNQRRAVELSNEAALSHLPPSTLRGIGPKKETD